MQTNKRKAKHNMLAVLTKKQNTAYLTLNRPNKRNALSPALIKTLHGLFSGFKKDLGLKAVVLKGEGAAFCSGADLKYLKDPRLFGKQNIRALFSLLELIEACPVPVLACVHGFVMGGGLGLMSVCDVVLAEKQSRFQFSEVGLGLVPSVISPFILKKMPLHFARFYMLTGWPFTAQSAYDAGCVHFVGTSKACDVFLNKLLSRIQNLDLSAVKKTKQVLQQFYLKTPAEVKTKAINIIHTARQTAEAQKRINQLFKK